MKQRPEWTDSTATHVIPSSWRLAVLLPSYRFRVVCIQLPITDKMFAPCDRQDVESKERHQNRGTRPHAKFACD